MGGGDLCAQGTVCEIPSRGIDTVGREERHTSDTKDVRILLFGAGTVFGEVSQSSGVVGTEIQESDTGLVDGNATLEGSFRVVVSDPLFPDGYLDFSPETPLLSRNSSVFGMEGEIRVGSEIEGLTLLPRFLCGGQTEEDGNCGSEGQHLALKCRRAYVQSRR